MTVDWSGAQAQIQGALPAIFGILGIILLVVIAAAVVRSVSGALSARGSDE